MPGERERQPGDPDREPVGQVGEKLQEAADEEDARGAANGEGDDDPESEAVRARTDAVGGADPGREHESPGWGVDSDEAEIPEPNEPG